MPMSKPCSGVYFVGIAPITEYASNGLGYLGTALLVVGLVKFRKG